jgi:hypothetical protein
MLILSRIISTARAFRAPVNWGTSRAEEVKIKTQSRPLPLNNSCNCQSRFRFDKFRVSYSIESFLDLVPRETKKLNKQSTLVINERLSF